MAALEIIETETGPQPVATIVILHGLGADGNDFVPIAQELDLKAIGSVRFVFPHAPVMPVTINNGFRMRAWYDILGFGAGSREDETGLRKSMAEIEELLAREKKRGMPADRIVLGGFSQGCALALMTGVRHRQRLAAIAGMSGYLPLATTTAAERSDANALTPIFMGHGRQDEVVDVGRGQASRDALKALGYEVQWHDYPMGHSVCMEEIEDLGRWLVKVLA
ncbi:MAG TPA: alpha/beta fold hydrolase [Ramlibacter sp.]|nr:alpha/beta fold hydrolase [Ramlibacter sp.]